MTFNLRVKRKDKKHAKIMIHQSIYASSIEKQRISRIKYQKSCFNIGGLLIVCGHYRHAISFQ